MVEVVVVYGKFCTRGGQVTGKKEANHNNLCKEGMLGQNVMHYGIVLNEWASGECSNSDGQKKGEQVEIA